VWQRQARGGSLARRQELNVSQLTLNIVKEGIHEKAGIRGLFCQGGTTPAWHNGMNPLACLVITEQTSIKADEIRDHH